MEAAWEAARVYQGNVGASPREPAGISVWSLGAYEPLRAPNTSLSDGGYAKSAQSSPWLLWGL